MSVGVKSPFTSVELRWFLEGGADDNPGLKRWFEAEAPLPGRTGTVDWVGRRGGVADTYLMLPGYENMGIKRREGSLQVKGLVADLGAISFPAGHEGRVQRWIKWTHADAPVLFDREDRGAVDVYKTRAVRLVEIEAPGNCSEVSACSRVEQGVAFEMTDLRVHGRAFSTIAFEAFPDSESTRVEIHTVAARFLDGLAEPRLDLLCSMSYPAWLNTLLA